jgi:hypothetical protein
MASNIMPMALEGETFTEALCVVCGFFQVEKLYTEQIIALKNSFLGNNIFFSAGTGYGKSLVSLMVNQVAYLKSIGLNAAAVYNGQDEEILRDVEESLFSHIYATPESMPSVKRWQKMLQSPYFIEHCVVVAIDDKV